jgi:hypothetical protein
MRRIAAVAVFALFLPGSSPAQVVVTAPDTATGTDLSQNGGQVLPAAPVNQSGASPSEPDNHSPGGTPAGLTPMNRLALSPVPEPTTLMLTAAGMLGLGAVYRRRAIRWRRELEKGTD